MKLLISLLVFTNLIFAQTKQFTLNEAINIALENNHQSKISKVALEIANVQYNQALSANYPALNAMIAGQRNKYDLVIQQRRSVELPAQLSAIAEKIKVDVKAKGRDTIKGSLNVLYPLFTGGKISSIIEQSKLNKLLAMNTIKRDNLTVIYDIKKYFYGYILTNELYKITKSTLSKMNYVSTLTKQFYESGESLNVNKTDYLSIQVTVTLLESIVAKIEGNRFMIKSALSNAMGLSWNSEIEPMYIKTELLAPNYSLSKLVQDAYSTNSDIRKMDIALKISKEQIKEHKADHYPTVALMGELSHTYNSYEYGYLNKDNADSWNIGFTAKLPLFDGFKTTNKVNEKKLEKKKLFLLQDMIKEAVAIQIKNELNNALLGFKQIQTLKKAKKLARKSMELNIRAYQIDAIKSRKVIESQYIESYVKADYLKYVHDYLLSLAKIDKLIGQEVK